MDHANAFFYCISSSCCISNVISSCSECYTPARRVGGFAVLNTAIRMQAVVASLSLSLAPGLRVAAPLGGRLRPVSMTASLEAPTTAPKSFDELDLQAADRMPQRA
jgi:hypothetical protein